MPVRSVLVVKRCFSRRQHPATDGIALLPAWMADRVIQVQGASLITQDQQQVATILQLV